MYVYILVEACHRTPDLITMPMQPGDHIFMIDALKKYPSIAFDLAWVVFCCSAFPTANDVRIFKETFLIDSMGGKLGMKLAWL